MGIQQKDLKILWGKSAGRCSMSDCRKKLDMPASIAVPSRASLFGENCHIVAEEEGGPRGKSSLTLKERNRYPNLILLCANHHTLIDDDPDAWPVDLLHQVKSDHELWVESKLSEGEDSDLIDFYSSMVNMTTDTLLLNKWDWVCENAFRLLLQEEFVNGVDQFCIKVWSANWPNEGLLELRVSIENLSNRLKDYVDHFMSRSLLVMNTMSDSGVYREDRSWKKRYTTNYEELVALSNQWRDESLKRLANVVVALNEFADIVRECLKPTYFLYEGKFMVCDLLGMTNNGEGTVYFIPSEYRDV